MGSCFQAKLNVTKKGVMGAPCDSNTQKQSIGVDKDSIIKIQQNSNIIEVPRHTFKKKSNKKSIYNGHHQYVDNLKEIIKENKVDFYKIIQEDITNFYKFDKLLGQGSFGRVSLAQKIGVEGFYAIKSISIEKMDKAKLLALKTEINSLTLLDHPNIVKFYEFFVDGKYIHLVMEACLGGELLDLIYKNGKFSESFSRSIMVKLLGAIYHCHQNNIVHRDIKPENIIFETQSLSSEPKIIDFGLSCKFQEDQKLESFVGSPFFVAPEIINGNYDSKCDIWSFGVLLFMLICGEPPFYSEDRAELFNQICQNEVSFDEHKVWKSISDSAKDLIKSMLRKDPTSRPNAQDCLQHPFFSQELEKLHDIAKVNDEVGKIILFDLKKYHLNTKFKKRVMHTMINFLSQQELRKLEKFFHGIDTNNTGKVSIFQLKKAFQDCGNEIAMDELEDLVKEYGNNDHNIKYSNFLEAVVYSKMNISSEFLWNAFKYFDVDQNGFITFEDLDQVLSRNGNIITNQELTQIMREMGKEVNSKIDFAMFKEIILLKDSKIF